MKNKLQKVSGLLSAISWIIVAIVILAFETTSAVKITLLAWVLLYISRNLLTFPKLKGQKVTIKYGNEIK